MAGNEAYPPGAVTRKARDAATFVFDRKERAQTLAFLKNRHLSCLSEGAQF
jgi:hypothetical protein